MTGSISIRIDDLCRGEDDAALFVWKRFFPQMKHLAKLRLKGISDPVADEEDVAAKAFASFCRGIVSGRFERLEDRDDISQILLMLTLRKAIDFRRHVAREKRGGNKTGRRIDGQGAVVLSRDEVEVLASSTPTPELAVLLAEEFDKVIGQLEQPELQEIALAKLEGFTDDEIAKRRGCARRTIVRKLRVIRGIWQASMLKTED